MSNWLPIESAPRDGAPIILGYARSHSCEGYWMGDASRNHWGETGWFDADSDVLCEHAHKPDAWQPLPAPPSSADAARESEVVNAWTGEIECCDAKGFWLILAHECPFTPGQKVTITAARESE